jgi:hypothetical protein
VVLIVLCGATYCYGNKPPPVLPPWESAYLDVVYGATFDLTKAPHRVDVREAYQFVEKGKRAPKIVAYCVVSDDFKTSGDFKECPLEAVVNNEIRLAYTYDLKDGRDFTVKSYLYEEFVLSGKLVWGFYRGSKGQIQRMPLNRFERLKDGFGNQDNKRMTTVVLPRNTFITLDEGEREPSPSVDIIHYPRPFFEESLEPRTTVITRVNPNIPLALRWGSQRLVSAGIEDIIGQWLLLSLSGVTPIAVVSWLARSLWRRKPLVPAPVPAEQSD